jgi:DNA-binding LacI/PurR family transcriptional regulator
LKSRTVSIADLARAAGVSKTTVSHAFSGKRPVDPETRERIERLALDLGYRPNPAAKQLRTGRAGVIALASSMPLSISAGPSRLGFLMEIAASAAVAALTQGTALCLLPPVETMAEPVDIALDGVILVEPARDDPLVAWFERRAIPMVSIGKVPDRPDLPHVDLRSQETAMMMLRHLAGQGASRIGLVTGTARRTSYIETEAAYARFCADRDVPAVAIRLEEDLGQEGAAIACRRMLAEHRDLDGLFIPVDAFASGAVEAAATLGRPMPGELRLATRYDGLRAKLSSPPLTAVNMALEEIASKAVSLLMKRIDGALPEAMPRLHAIEIVERASSRP